MIEMYVMAALGFALHVLKRWNEYRRAVEPVGIFKYIAQDPVAWTSSIVGTVAAALMLPEIGPSLGLAANKAGFFVVGYSASSLVASLPGILAPKVASPDLR